MTKIWLEQLYQNEIEEVEGAIANERIWGLGGSEFSESNIAELEEYLETLNELKAGVE